MRMSPYLIFNGGCAEAFPFYERVLGGRIVMMYPDADQPGDAGGGGGSQYRVMRARLELGAFALRGADADPGDVRPAGRNVYVWVSVPAADAERIFSALAADGRITMPFESTFWSPGLGMLVDQFGTPWVVSTDPGS